MEAKKSDALVALRILTFCPHVFASSFSSALGHRASFLNLEAYAVGQGSGAARRINARSIGFEFRGVEWPDYRSRALIGRAVQDIKGEGDFLLGREDGDAVGVGVVRARAIYQVRVWTVGKDGQGVSQSDQIE